MANEDVMCQDNVVLPVVCRSIQPSDEVILVHSQALVREAINAINGKGLVVIDYNHEAGNIRGWEKDIVFHNNPQADHRQYEGPVEKAQVPHPNSKPAYTDTGPDCGPKLSYNTSGPDRMIHNDTGDPGKEGVTSGNLTPTPMVFVTQIQEEKVDSMMGNGTEREDIDCKEVMGDIYAPSNLSGGNKRSGLQPTTEMASPTIGSNTPKAHLEYENSTFDIIEPNLSVGPNPGFGMDGFVFESPISVQPDKDLDTN
ncbi:hypothetical protein LWI29_034657 [Acer saccharum]|uniref:Uncharacterized protein n=1 Tax=Acer saccharum TaxID=4024 RepID=A0AA39VET8_ACESA|nr:hypothetical protein LWI29_034657 [Acer saccharum]